jgi:hypothetical protein
MDNSQRCECGAILLLQPTRCSGESIFVPVNPGKPRLSGCETEERNVLFPLFQNATYDSPIDSSVSSLSSYLHGTESSLGNNGKYIVTYLLKAITVEPEKQPLLANGSETIFVSRQRPRNRQQNEIRC